jgi:hypothetical protein
VRCLCTCLVLGFLTLSRLHNKTRSHAFHLLCHICMDSRVLSNADILHAVQDALEAIVCQFPDNHKLVSGVGSPSTQDPTTALIVSQLRDVVPRLLQRITHPILQKSLVCALPTRTPLTAYLQRYLALSFLLYPTTVDVPLEDPTIPSFIHKHLDNSPDFRTRKDTDYSFLAARFTLLDLAIGPGPSPALRHRKRAHLLSRPLCLPQQRSKNSIRKSTRSLSTSNCSATRLWKLELRST